MTIKPIDIFYLPPDYPLLPIPGESLDIGCGQYMDVAADGIGFPCTGNNVIMVQGGLSDHVITIKTVGDQFKRTGDILYNVGAGKLVVLPKIQPMGFEQPDGTAIITGDVGSEELDFWVFDDIRKYIAWGEQIMARDTFNRVDGAPGTTEVGRHNWIGGVIDGNSLKIIPTLDAEMIVDGGFDDPANWTCSAGWSVSGGLLHAINASNGSSAAPQTPIATLAGQVYATKLDVTNPSGEQAYLTGLDHNFIDSLDYPFFTEGGGNIVFYNALIPLLTADFDNFSVKNILIPTSIACININKLNYSIEVTISATNSNPINYQILSILGIVARVDDPATFSNGIKLHFWGSGMQLFEYISGVGYWIAENYTLTQINSGDKFTMTINGDRVNVFYTPVTTGIEIPLIINKQIHVLTGDYCGIYSTSDENKFSKFVVAKI